MSALSNKEVNDLIIVGAGPAGYTAAIYAKRAGLNPLLITGLEIGGQLMQTTHVDNYPGFTTILGPTLMNNMKEQVALLRVPMVSDYIKASNFNVYPYMLLGESKTYYAKSVIIATGSSARWLNIKGESEFKGFGVSACATCDGFFFKNQSVAVVGGGNTALGEALYLSSLAKEVFLIHRRDQFRGEKLLQDQVLNTPNIKIIWNSIVEEIIGDNNPKTVRKIILKNVIDEKSHTLSIDGFFVAIGHNPNTTFLKDQVDIDEEGYLKTLNNSCVILKNNKPLNGVFGAGDVIDKIYKQAVTSAGTGCMAALDAKNYLQSLKN